MLKLYPVFLSCLFLTGCFCSASAQTALPDKPPPACQVQIRIYPIEALKEESPAPLNGAKVVLKNAAGKTIESAAESDHLYSGLPAGDYQARATLSGYKTTGKAFRIECDNSWMPADTVFAEHIFLWKGDPKETVDGAEKFRGVFAVAAADSTGKAATAGVATDPASIINGKARRLVKPTYPPAARAVRASGAVGVQVTVDELGTVVSARPVGGHPLLRAAAVKAAFESKFSPTTLEGYPVKVVGVVVYNFTAQ